jgi:hypothetical protein
LGSVRECPSDLRGRSPSGPRRQANRAVTTVHIHPPPQHLVTSCMPPAGGKRPCHGPMRFPIQDLARELRRTTLSRQSVNSAAVRWASGGIGQPRPCPRSTPCGASCRFSWSRVQADPDLVEEFEQGPSLGILEGPAWKATSGPDPASSSGCTCRPLPEGRGDGRPRRRPAAPRLGDLPHRHHALAGWHSLPA